MRLYTEPIDFLVALLSEPSDTDTVSLRGIAGSSAWVHALLGAAVWFFPGLLVFLGGHPGSRLNPETAMVMAIVGTGLLVVPAVLALAGAHRLVEFHEDGKRGLLAALGLGFGGPVIYGVAGSVGWGLASLLVAREIEALILSGPALAAGLSAPLVALVCAGGFVFLRATR
ncbi:hypothetical protein BRD56_09885 [Thermoplasmatales archaeon SW_10_69_26]|nr:MAG: hypothetical protein BRD56_09885 [Thermoplasmatales archaeon SW_10_69_26]